MENHFFEDIKQVIQSFKQKLEQHLPAMKLEVSNLIFSKSKDKNKIENTLDTLLSLIDIGI